MSWQYRIIAHPKVEEGEVIFKVHRLHISTSGRRYLDESIDLAFEEPHGLNDLLISIKQALKKPILWGDVDSDRFLTEVKITYTCLLCGRDTFTHKFAHNCLNGRFQRHHIHWKLNCK